MVIAWQDLIAIADLLTKSEAKRSILTFHFYSLSDFSCSNLHRKPKHTFRTAHHNHRKRTKIER